MGEAGDEPAPAGMERGAFDACLFVELAEGLAEDVGGERLAFLSEQKELADYAERMILSSRSTREQNNWLSSIQSFRVNQEKMGALTLETFGDVTSLEGQYDGTLREFIPVVQSTVNGRPARQRLRNACHPIGPEWIESGAILLGDMEKIQNRMAALMNVPMEWEGNRAIMKLAPQFSMRMINTDRNLVLNLEIYDLDGTLIYQDQAGPYDGISVRRE